MLQTSSSTVDTHSPERRERQVRRVRGEIANYQRERWSSDSTVSYKKRQRYSETESVIGAMRRGKREMIVKDDEGTLHHNPAAVPREPRNATIS
jgi:FtsZ-interacting cell division protein YlmF